MLAGQMRPSETGLAAPADPRRATEPVQDLGPAPARAGNQGGVNRQSTAAAAGLLSWLPRLGSAAIMTDFRRWLLGQRH